jgi:hypothetical protein
LPTKWQYKWFINYSFISGFCCWLIVLDEVKRMQLQILFPFQKQFRLLPIPKWFNHTQLWSTGFMNVVKVLQNSIIT